MLSTAVITGTLRIKNKYFDSGQTCCVSQLVDQDFYLKWSLGKCIYVKDFAVTFER